MGVMKEVFGNTKDGKEVLLFTLENSKGMKARVMNFGAILVNLYAPDHNGKVADVVLGYDKLHNYFVNGSFFGSVIGPNANRIAEAQFTLDGEVYHLDANEGPNNLHSHREKGIHKRVWEAAEGDNSVTFTLSMEDGELGFPGNKKFSITYTLTEDNELKLHYHGNSDKNTIINLTNHSYFNLDGHDAGNVGEHTVRLLADAYTPIHQDGIPTGEIVPVEGTPMDFRTPKKIGLQIDDEWEQLTMVGGYDHNWALNDYNGCVRLAAVVSVAGEGQSGSETARTMEVYTDLPGVQFYTGNFMTEETGKGGANYGVRNGFCLETQHFPNAANEPDFPSAVFGPDREYDSTTIFKFC